MTRSIRRQSCVACLAMLACLLAPASALAQSRCEDEQARAASPTGARYILILAGRTGTFYDHSGPTFAMALKVAGEQVQIDAVGVYSVNGHPVFGAVPRETYLEMMKEPREASAVLLRFAMTQAQHLRALAILRQWDRRAREGTLLYPETDMNNILLAKQVVESLNACGERVTLYSLDWGVKDHISENNPRSHVPFLYFRELRRLNEARHVRDGDMPALARSDGPRSARGSRATERGRVGQPASEREGEGQ